MAVESVVGMWTEARKHLGWIVVIQYASISMQLPIYALSTQTARWFAELRLITSSIFLIRLTGMIS